MKQLAAALVVIALIAADLMSSMPVFHQTASMVRDWRIVDSCGLIFGGAYFWTTRDGS